MNLFDEQLNQSQKEAVETLEGPLLVLAGAGSGKTRVVTFRIVHLLESGISPSQILGLTFTNKAAEEMKERVRNLTKHHVLICTFHSLGARILRESIHYLGYSSNFFIYDENDSETLLKACLNELKIDDKKGESKNLRAMISRAKNDMLSPEDVETNFSVGPLQVSFKEVYSCYQTKLFQCNALDFDDLLWLPVRLFREHPTVLGYYQQRWSFVLIDEYQDTNMAQYSLIHLLVSKRRNLCVVGDPDQSIYSWRGANVKNILNFEHDYPGAKIVRLELNYRSRTNILEAANALISYNTNRYEKNLWSNLGPGEKIKTFAGENERYEAAFVVEKIRHHYQQENIPFKQMVIFYRTNFQSRLFEDVLLARRIPYVIVGGLSFYQRREIKDILAFLRVALLGTDFVSFTRTINLPKRGIGETTIEKIRVAADQEKLSIFAYCEALVGDGALNHSIKLPSRQKEAIRDYIKMINQLKVLKNKVSLKEMVMAAIDLTNYLEFLKEDPETFEDRQGNINQLITKAVEWEISAENPTLEGFLEELSLKSSLDEADTTQDRVNLMTLHNGKGLEFDVSFLVGMEEGLLPHANSIEDLASLEEERRLCYVGVTRTRQYLYLTRSKIRYLWGNLRDQRPSRFIEEIPSKYKQNAIPHVSFSQEFKPKKEESEVKFIDEVDQTVSIQDINFAPGDAVFHKEFGVGVLRETYQGSLGLTYKIQFSKDNKIRTLVAKYAHLKPV